MDLVFPSMPGSWYMWPCLNRHTFCLFSYATRNCNGPSVTARLLDGLPDCTPLWISGYVQYGKNGMQES
jgi:hypothetical protein